VRPALLAHACNLGYARMGQAARIDPQQLAWITHGYLRPEALAAANARIVDAHHALGLRAGMRDGRFSSSGADAKAALDPGARVYPIRFGCLSDSVCIHRANVGDRRTETNGF
jgi:TnpA family transposase